VRQDHSLPIGIRGANPLSLGRLVFDVSILILLLLVVFETADFHRLARYFPQYVALAASVLAALGIALDIFKLRSGAQLVGGSDIAQTATLSDSSMSYKHVLLRAGRYLGWMLSFVLAVWIFGLVLAVALFLLSFFAAEARIRWWANILGTALALFLLITFSSVMNMRWPGSLMDVMLLFE
jgi:hypothetical protein